MQFSPPVSVPVSVFSASIGPGLRVSRNLSRKRDSMHKTYADILAIVQLCRNQRQEAVEGAGVAFQAFLSQISLSVTLQVAVGKLPSTRRPCWKWGRLSSLPFPTRVFGSSDCGCRHVSKSNFLLDRCRRWGNRSPSLRNLGNYFVEGTHQNVDQS